MTEYRGQEYRFSADARLAAGGMGEVYLGSRLDDLAIHVAIKVPLGALPPEDKATFLREADAARRVSSPYVVSVVDWGNDPPFIAFEYMQGGTLDQELRRREGEQQFWSERELVGHFRELALAMKAINERVIHRDLKPQNIFLDGDTLKVSDFGIAKYVGELTRSRTFKGWGSAPYMAPESFRAESVDWRADQYALGVILYEMASLRRPFVGSFDELEKAHLYQAAPRLNVAELGLSQRLATLVAKMLEKQVVDRFGSWDSVLGELDAIERRLESAVERRPDPLADRVAAGIEQVRARNLSQQQAAEDAARRVHERDELVDYWAARFFDAVKERVRAINENIGTEAVEVNGSGRPGIAGKDRVFGASWLNARLLIALDAISPEGSDTYFGWGRIELKSNKRLWIGNLLLWPNPAPYGHWAQVDMQMNVLTQGRGDPTEEDRTGGRYEVLGG
jgi:serine/threonine protein kinase